MQVYHAPETPARDKGAEISPLPEKMAEEEVTRVFLSRRMDAYGLFEWACGEVWGMKGLPPMARQKAGKPYFPGLEGYYFSLSHSGGWAMCALSRREVGCDVERVVPRRENLPRRVFGREMDWEEFYRRWTEMEAYGKWTGEGIGPLVRRKFVRPDEVKCCQRRLEDSWAAVCYGGGKLTLEEI